MPDKRPTGRGALANVPELTGDLFLARQPAVSAPKIEEMMQMMRGGAWDWTGREIKINGSVIIDGHHRYIAARLTGIEPVFLVSTEPVHRTFAWRELTVDSKRWPGSY